MQRITSQINATNILCMRYTKYYRVICYIMDSCCYYDSCLVSGNVQRNTYAELLKPQYWISIQIV